MKFEKTKKLSKKKKEENKQYHILANPRNPIADVIRKRKPDTSAKCEVLPPVV